MTWDRRLIRTLSVLDVEYMLCETIPNNNDEKSKRFQFKAEKDSVIKMKNKEISIKAREGFSFNYNDFFQYEA